MAKKSFKVNYFYPTAMTFGKVKVVNMKPILTRLEQIDSEVRLIKDGEGNIQLKSMKYDKISKRWYLAFLKNQIDAPFKTKLNDNIERAEPLDDDEFIGIECCVIYDETSKIMSVQNNRGSVSFAGISKFFSKYMSDELYLQAITYQEKYCDISDDDLINYKSLIISYTDISELVKIGEKSGNKTLKSLGEICNDLSALNGRIELGVGRTKSFLEKLKLRETVNLLKGNNKCTKGLKVKMQDHDTIRIIDLLSNKVNDDCQISITKNDPKTFQKIFDSMDSAFDSAVVETFNKCNKFINE